MAYEDLPIWNADPPNSASVTCVLIKKFADERSLGQTVASVWLTPDSCLTHVSSERSQC